MKKMKKLFAILMTMAMVMGLSITGFAKKPGLDNVYGTKDDRGTITVSGLTQEDGITVTAYPIIEATYDDINGNFTGYDSLYTGVIPEEEIEADNLSTSITQDDLNAIYKVISGTNPATEGYTMTSENGTIYTAEVPVGAYLVIISGAETTVYNPVIVSVDYERTSQGGNDLGEGNVNISVDEEHSYAWVKASTVPEVDKTVSSDIKNEDTDKGNSADIGDSVTYDVTVNPIPYYGGDNPTLNIVDTLSEGLTYNENSLSVKVYNGETDETGTLLENTTEKTYYTPNYANGNLTVNFVVDGKYTLNDYATQKLVITYSATVNENAAINEGGNTNDVTLNYTTDSKITTGQDKDEDKTYTYTFDINGSVSGNNKVITKTGEGEDVDALKGAEFTLYTDGNCTQVYKNDKFKNGCVVESDETGQLEIVGLAEGTYYLKETKAPADYSVNTHVFEIKIVAEYNLDGTLKLWTITIDGEKTSTFTVTNEGVSDNVQETEIKNTTITALPSTGGMGTTLFTIAGCVIMISAAGLFFATRKKAN